MWGFVVFGLERITFSHFTDITFCHKLVIKCRFITNESTVALHLVTEPLIFECRLHHKLSALTTWLHLEQTFTLEYDLQIGGAASFFILCCFLFFTLRSLLPTSVYSFFSLLFVSFLIVSPSACPQYLLLCPCPSRSSFCLWPLSLHPHSPLSVSLSWATPFSSGCWPVAHPLHSPASPWVAVERHQERSTCPPLFLPPPNTNCRGGRHIVFLVSKPQVAVCLCIQTKSLP